MSLRYPARLALVWAGIAAVAACSGPKGPDTMFEQARLSLQSSDRPRPEVPADPDPMSPPLPGQSRRVGGDTSALVIQENGEFRAGPCRIDTPLPLGYPPPTPPGAIDLKSYPAVRRAEVRGSGHPDGGMNRAFWPLFNHIKRHDIAMTSPVEVDFQTPLAAATLAPPPLDRKPEGWSMAFLYRIPELNEPGTDGNVLVRDADPVTVVSVGLRGRYTMDLVLRGVESIERWLSDNPQWIPAGDWRALYYNGPALMYWNKWAEIQLPVRPAESKHFAREDRPR